MTKQQHAIWSDGYDSRVAGQPITACKRRDPVDAQIWAAGWLRAETILTAVGFRVSVNTPERLELVARVRPDEIRDGGVDVMGVAHA